MLGVLKVTLFDVYVLGGKRERTFDTCGGKRAAPAIFRALAEIATSSSDYILGMRRRLDPE